MYYACSSSHATTRLVQHILHRKHQLVSKRSNRVSMHMLVQEYAHVG